ncbi:MAG: hypothetical protein P1U89_18150 [Verrucomicrobiales bacterium]|nr:hypothetical protein [Verrucomicrobiales bacterium]
MNRLADSEIDSLSKRLKKDPGDFECRMSLIKHYWRNRYHSKEDAENHARLVFWLIENEPDNEVLSDPYCSFRTDGGDYLNRARELFDQAAKANSKKAAVLVNAGWFYYQMGLPEAEGLLRKCCELESESPTYFLKLGEYYSLSPNGIEDCERKSLEAFETAYHLSDDDSGFYQLQSLSQAAFSMGDLKKAAKYAKQLLKGAESRQEDWNYWNAIHWGNIILGRVSFQKGEVSKAAQHLVTSVKESKGSPQLNSFGPDIDLLQELIDLKQFDAGLAYLAECRKFWSSDRGQRFMKAATELFEGQQTADLIELKCK